MYSSPCDPVIWLEINTIISPLRILLTQTRSVFYFEFTWHWVGGHSFYELRFSLIIIYLNYLSTWYNCSCVTSQYRSVGGISQSTFVWESWLPIDCMQFMLHRSRSQRLLISVSFGHFTEDWLHVYLLATKCCRSKTGIIRNACWSLTSMQIPKSMSYSPVRVNQTYSN